MSVQVHFVYRYNPIGHRSFATKSVGVQTFWARSWRRISNVDILAMERVDKPSLLKQLFELATVYAGQILSYNKMLGQLHDAGNHHHFGAVLEPAFERRAGRRAAELFRECGSSKSVQPQINRSQYGSNVRVVRVHIRGSKGGSDLFGTFLVESAVGCTGCSRHINVRYPFVLLAGLNPGRLILVLQRGQKLVSIDPVKSGQHRKGLNGPMAAFSDRFDVTREVVCRRGRCAVGGVSVESGR